jgi:hypothetical protein
MMDLEKNITYEMIMGMNPCYGPHTELGMPKDYNAPLSEFIVEYRNKVKGLGNIPWIVL